MSEAELLRKNQGRSFGHVLFTCARLLDETAQEQANLELGERLARPSVMRLLPFLTFEGVRPTELARRLDISKQAVGQALAMLEEKQLVEYLDDPHDGRGRLVRLTAAGAGAFQHGLDVLAFFEHALAEEVGATVVKNTLQGLQKIMSVLEAWGATGAPRRKVSPPGKSVPAKTSAKKTRTVR